MRKAGLKPMWSDKDVSRFFDAFIDQAERKIYIFLQRAGEEFVKYARKKGSYQDHTGNLRASIGYVILKDGDILSENYEMPKNGTDKHTGINEAKRLVKEMSQLYKNGFVLVGVAGMRYAVFVEGIHNLDVVTGASVHTEEWIKKTSKKLFESLKKKGY